MTATLTKSAGRSPSRRRRSGARLPFSTPGTAGGAPFEGYYWRLTDSETGRVVVAFCGLCKSPTFSLAGLSAHPGHLVRSRIGVPASDACQGVGVVVPGLCGDENALRVEIAPDVSLEAEFAGARAFPRRMFGATGPAQLVPRLTHYWQPILIGGRASGELRIADQVVRLRDAKVYAERTWGRSFPDRWWWGQADAFDSDGSVCVAFAGGRVNFAGATVSPTALVVRLGERVLTFAPPRAHMRMSLGPGRWRLEARSLQFRVAIEGDDPRDSTRLLPIPSASSVSASLLAAQALAGRLSLRVECGRHRLFSGTSELAGLEQAVGR